MSGPIVQENERGVTFVAKIVPGSSKTVVVGWLDNMIKIRVAAAPEKGKANQCLVRFLAKRLGIKKNTISLLSGQTSPVKQIRIVGISVRTLLEGLGLSEQGSG
jgi:uncharacterized protein (TIGR00251 family)